MLTVIRQRPLTGRFTGSPRPANNFFPALAKHSYFPLFLDTVLTVTLTLTGGLFWGAYLRSYPDF
jgi:hypothetical protein